MVLSRAFRSSSQASDGVVKRDPDNIYLSYYKPRRLDAEAIMDSINSLAEDDFERAVYRDTIRNKPDPFLTTFNLPIPVTTISSRDITNVPAQALSLLNGKFVREAANDWAAGIRDNEQLKTTDERINAFFLDAYAREATDSEREKLVKYCDSFEDANEGLKKVAFALLNTKEFIYVY